MQLYSLQGHDSWVGPLKGLSLRSEVWEAVCVCRWENGRHAKLGVPASAEHITIKRGPRVAIVGHWPYLTTMPSVVTSLPPSAPFLLSSSLP